MTGGTRRNPRSDPSREMMAGVGLLAGGVTAFVLVLLVGAVNVVTPWAVPLRGMAGIVGITGLAVAIDSARQSSPSAVVARCSAVVAPTFLVAGLALGGYVWVRLGPVARQQAVTQYAPAVPVVLGALLAVAVGVLGRLFDRQRRRGP